MLKRLLKYFSFDTLSSALLLFCAFALFTGCAPKIAPPPLYRNVDLSLEKLITIAQRDINSLKAIVSIDIKEDNRQHSFVDASLLLKKPRSIDMRLYKFGMLVGNFIIKDSIVLKSSGKGSGTFREFGNELYDSIFWWEGVENASLYKQRSRYIIRTENREIRIDRSTLLPISQDITVKNKKIHIKYDKHRKAVTELLTNQSGTDFWYPSELRLEMGSFTFNIRVKKLITNPPPGENDFKS